jgi:predicted Ser/Thr protein kinase
VDGNRGAIEYSDLLKRPVDSFKYLLSACEIASINVGNSIAHLDSVMLGSTNDLQLDAFKEFPDFSSFKGRIELIRVPICSLFSRARNLRIGTVSNGRRKTRCTPVSSVVALWAILTRLKKPNSINYPPNVSTLISNILHRKSPML